MKKKLIALASLLCSATLCTSVGAAMLNSNEQVVSAETVTSTWTDSATGTTYTFEGDINTHNATDIRDYGMHDLLKTSEGVTGYNTDPYKTAWHNQCMVSGENAAWVAQTGGVAFKFKTDDYWYSPACNYGGQTDENCRVNVYYGDLWINIAAANWGSPCIAVYLQSNGVDVSRTGQQYYIENFFGYDTYQGAPKNKLCYLKDWVTVKISKYDCTSAGGYWLKLSLNDTLMYNKYIANEMTTSTLNDFGIANATAGRIGQDGCKVSEAKWKNHSNLLTVKSTYADNTATATVDTETYKDVGDLTSENSSLAETYVKGLTEWGSGRYYTDKDFIPNGTENSVGLEVRAKHPSNTALATHGSECYSFINMLVGGTYVYADYSPSYKSIRFWAYNINDGWKQVGVTTNHYFEYDLTREYAWRVTRTNVNFAESSMNGRGAIIKLYIGEINSTTGSPAADWADKPVFVVYDPNTRKGTDVAVNGLSVGVGNQDCPAHAMIFSSNKYVAFTTNVNGVETVNKVVRGGSFTLPTLTQENMIHVGWSKGAETYSEGDFLANGTTFENVTAPMTVKALAMTLETDKKASMRFRKRGDNPTEVSLNWKVVATDSSNLGYYFGNINFGYKLTADMMTSDTSDDKTTEGYVENYTNGFESPYQYSITQSNIGQAYYTMNFVCQAFVEFEINGVKTKFYTANTPSLTEDGRSVAYIADKAVADARNAIVTENGVEYKNAIQTAEGTKYHYLTQAQYNLLVNVLAK